MPQLIIQERGENEPFVHTCAEEVVTIGRQDDNIVQLRGKGVSRRHARIHADGERFFLTDLKSGNGTFLNGMRLAPEERHLLRAGDLITIDTFDIRFHSGEADRAFRADEEVTGSDILEVKLLKKVLTALDKEMVPSIEVLNGSAEGKKVFLTDDVSELTIGRDPECDFPINEYAISRQHAKVIKRWGGIAIRDLESKNGTFVNNRRVVEEYMHDGDRIAFGTIVCIFRNPQEINLAQIEDIKPKARPAQVSPREIPGTPEAEEFPEEAPAEAEEAAPAAEETRDESQAMEEWERLERSRAGQAAYPPPRARVEAIKKLTPIEIGMIGLGVLVLIFAMITIVNLLFT
jgi:pSer/pThr/pTyr-binding forkhead associated (FHA) protein